MSATPENPATPAASASHLKTAIQIAAAVYFLLVVVMVVQYCKVPGDIKFSEWLNKSSRPYALTVLNAGLLFLFLYLGLKGPVAAMLDKAAADTAGSLEQARAAMNAAENLRQREAGMERELATEKDELAARLEPEKKAASEKILAEAKSEAAKILEDVKLNLANDLDATKKQLRRELAAKALEEARARLTADAGAADQDRLFDAFIDDLEKPS